MPLTVLQIIGRVVHGDPDEHPPLKIGGRAHTSAPAAVDNGDIVNAYYDELGYQRVKVDNTISVALPSGIATEATLEFGNLFFGTSIRYYTLTENTLTSVHQFFNTMGGTTLSALTVTYTDSTKETISTIQRTT